MNKEFARIRAYLQVQAAKLAVPDLVAKVRGDLQQVKAAIESFPVDSWEKRPADEEWSANEVAAHLAGSSRSVADGIVAAIAGGQKPARIEDVMEHSDDHRGPADWWLTIESDREALFSRLATVKGDEHLDIKWQHPMFGDLNWREWLLFTRIHDLDHAHQIGAVALALASGSR
jgi:DinB superfamily